MLDMQHTSYWERFSTSHVHMYLPFKEWALLCLSFFFLYFYNSFHCLLIVTFSLYFRSQNSNYWISKHLQHSLLPPAFLWFAVSVSKLANECGIGWDGEGWRKWSECNFNMVSYAVLNQTWYYFCKSKMNPRKSEPLNLIQFFFSKKNIRHLLRKNIVPADTQICLPFPTELVIKNLQTEILGQVL